MPKACRLGVVALAAAALVSSAASASAVEDVKRIYAEGMNILKAARAPDGDVVKGSKAAIALFEKAAGLLGEPADESPEAELLQDINSMLFWTRRTTPMDMSEIFGGSSGSSGSRASSEKESSDETPATDLRALARKAPGDLARAEAYARAHPKDYMSCSARFFEVADRYKDLHDIAFRAISRAQEFQRLADGEEAHRKAEAEFATLPREEQLTFRGDQAYTAKDYVEAAGKYAAAIKIKATPGRYRKLGHAHFNRAQDIRVEYTMAYLKARKTYAAALNRNDGRAAARATTEARAAGGIATRARDAYLEAEVAFQHARRKSPDHLDLDSDIHIALAHLIRRKPSYMRKAADMFQKILLTYHGKLKDDQDRTLYALAETYAGKKTVANVRAIIARRMRTPGARGEGKGEAEAPDEKPLGDLSNKELREEYVELKDKLKRDELKLKSSQLSGRFDKALLDRVNAERKRMKAIKADASRRGLR
jgi:tetratricopeptide (TPR) repeat protein